MLFRVLSQVMPKQTVKKCQFQSVTGVSTETSESFLFLPQYKWKFM